MSKGKKGKKNAGPPPAPLPTAPVKVPDHIYWVLLGIICLAGFYFRFKNLGYLSLWGDELFHVFAADNIIKKGQPLLLSGQYFADAPLLTYLLSIVHRIFGVGETTDRLLPFLFGFLTIPLVYWIGADLFKDKRIGLIAAAFIAVVPWYVVRAKVLRPYTAFQFSYLGFFYLFYKGFEAARVLEIKSGNAILDRARAYLAEGEIDVIFLLAALVVLYLGKKFQDLALQAAPTIIFYAAIMLMITIVQNSYKEVRFTKYAWVIYIGMTGVILSPFFVQLVSMRSLKDLIGWKDFIDRLSTAPFWAFKRYLADAIVALHPSLWIWGIAGIVLTVLKREKHCLYTLSFFLIPFLVQSFLFNNPNAVKAQYLFFVFPYFLLLSAYGLVRLVEQVVPKIVNGITENSRPIYAVIILVSLAFLYVPFTQSYAFANTKKHGDLKDRSQELYANWREGCAFVKKHMKADDLILSTQPWSVIYYLKKADYHIRMGFNKFEYLKAEYPKYRNALSNPNQPLWPLRGILSGVPILKDYNWFRWTVERHPRGWLIACHKFFNRAFVDQRAQQYVLKNFKQVYTDKDRSVVVYYWDFSQRDLDKPLLVIEEENGSFDFNFPDPRGIQGDLWLQLDIQNAVKAVLSQIILNNNGPLEFWRNDTAERQIMEAKIPSQWLHPGANRIIFDAVPGIKYSIYHVGITLDRDYQSIRSVL